MAVGIEKSIMVDQLTAYAFYLQLYGSTKHSKRPRLAASCGFYRLAENCQQVTASLLTSSSCSKPVKIRLVVT